MRFREIRMKNNTPMLSLCKELGISRFTLMRFEEGYVPPALKILTKIAGHFGVSTDHILELDSEGQEAGEEITTEEFEARLNNDKEYLRKFISCIKYRLVTDDI